MRRLVWTMMGTLGLALAATPDQTFRLWLWPGDPTDPGPAPLIYGRVRLVSEPSGWAFTFTHILNARTGKALSVSTGSVVYVGTDVFDLECGPASVPYCSWDRSVVVDRVNFRQAKVTRRELYLPRIQNCTYQDGFVHTITRHGPRYLDELIEASCGVVFARYDWAGKSNWPVKTQVLKSRTWPLPYPK